MCHYVTTTLSSSLCFCIAVNVTYIDVTPENEADAIFRLQPIPPNQNAVITSVTVLCQSDCACECLIDFTT